MTLKAQLGANGVLKMLAIISQDWSGECPGSEELKSINEVNY